MTEKSVLQKERFIKAARQSGADLTKEEFARVIGGLAKPQAPPKDADEDQASDD